MFREMSKLYRWPIIVLIVIFMIGVGLGALLPSTAKLWLLEMIAGKFENIIMSSPTDWSLSLNIFWNNVVVCGLLYLGGFLIVIPPLIIFGNGIIIGVFLALLYRADVLIPGNFISSAASLIPHGIFELSAFFLAGALSTVVALKTLFPQALEAHKLRRTVLFESVSRFILIIVPLLLSAALIETFVSPRVSASLSQWWAERQVDPDLEIPLNLTALAQHGCVTDSASAVISPQQGGSLSETLLFLAHTVYDPELYAVLQQRQAVSSWKQTWLCEQNTYLQIQSWRASEWSPAQAAYIITTTLERSGSPFERYENNDRARFTYTLASVNIAQTVTTVDTTTLVITQTNPTFTLNELLE